jgi:hypothetical protein
MTPAVRAPRWPANPADARSAIVIAVGGEPQRFYDRIGDAWFEWRMWFTKDIRHNTALIILLDANFYSGVDGVAQALMLDALDCDTQPDAACEVCCRLLAASQQPPSPCRGRPPALHKCMPCPMQQGALSRCCSSPSEAFPYLSIDGPRAARVHGMRL